MRHVDAMGLGAAIIGAFILAGALYWVDPPPRSQNQASFGRGSLEGQVALGANLSESQGVSRFEAAAATHR